MHSSGAATEPANPFILCVFLAGGSLVYIMGSHTDNKTHFTEMNLKYFNKPAFSLETVNLQTVIQILSFFPLTQSEKGFIPISQKI